MNGIAEYITDQFPKRNPMREAERSGDVQHYRQQFESCRSSAVRFSRHGELHWARWCAAWARIYWALCPRAIAQADGATEEGQR